MPQTTSTAESRNRSVPHQTLGSRSPSHYFCHSEFLSACSSETTIQSLAGAISGAASTIITCPLDVVKTRLQGRGGLQLWTLDTISTRRSFRDRGLVGTGRAIWREGGLSGMYQGLGPTLLATLPRRAIYFTVYHKINDSLSEKFSELS
jgi:solute carrier family 25 folate transporter 32